MRMRADMILHTFENCRIGHNALNAQNPSVMDHVCVEVIFYLPVQPVTQVLVVWVEKRTGDVSWRELEPRTHAVLWDTSIPPHAGRLPSSRSWLPKERQIEKKSKGKK